jgi:hypothetical protein
MWRPDTFITGCNTTIGLAIVYVQHCMPVLKEEKDDQEEEINAWKFFICIHVLVQENIICGVIARFKHNDRQISVQVFNFTLSVFWMLYRYKFLALNTSIIFHIIRSVAHHKYSHYNLINSNFFNKQGNT